MANNITMQNNIVTAGKFVTIGTGIDTSKQALRAIASAVAIEDQSALYREVQSIVDGGVSVSEKPSLRTLFSELSDRYIILYNNVQQVGYTGDDWDLVREKFSSMEDEFGKILFDMNSDYNEPTNIDALVQSYSSVSTSFSISLENYINSSDGYRIQLSVSPSHPLVAGETLEVTLSVYSPDGLQYALGENEVGTIQWYFGNTSDNSSFESAHRGENPLRISDWDSMFTGRSIEISASLTIYPS